MSVWWVAPRLRRTSRVLVAMVGVALVAGPGVASAQGFGSPFPLRPDAAEDGAREDTFPDVATDGFRTWIAVWDARTAEGDPEYGDDRDIFFATSTDAGASWSPAGHVNADAPVKDATGQDTRPRIATDGRHWVVVWRADDLAGGDEDIRAAWSEDGTTWNGPVAVDADDGGARRRMDNAPAVTTDGLGHWLVAWSARLDDRQLVYASVSYDHGTTWSPPRPVNPAAPRGTQSEFPDVATDGRLWSVVWSGTGVGGADRDIGIVTTDDPAAGWSAVRAVNADARDDAPSDRNPCIATDGAGGWIALWSRGEADDDVTDREIRVVGTGDPAGGWPAHTRLNDEIREVAVDDHPRVVPDGPGAWLVTWHARRLDPDVPKRTRTLAAWWNGARWARGPLVERDADPAAGHLPRLARNGAGEVVVVLQAVDLGGDGDVLVLPGDGFQCGNGLVDAGEQCDAGRENGWPGACCTAGCLAREAGRPCDGGRCDGSGACVPATTTTTSTSTSSTTTSSSTTTTSSTSTSSTARPATTTTTTTTTTTSSTTSSTTTTSTSTSSTTTSSTSSTTRLPTTTTSTSTTSTSSTSTSSTARPTTTTSTSSTTSSTTSTSTSTTATAPPSTTTSTAASTTTTTVAPLPAPRCGDAVVQDGEQCDLGSENGSGTACCTGSCTFRDKGETCRASAGTCDVADECTGAHAVCPRDAARPDGAPCSACEGAVCLAGACDQPDACGGKEVPDPAPELIAGPTSSADLPVALTEPEPGEKAKVKAVGFLVDDGAATSARRARRGAGGKAVRVTRTAAAVLSAHERFRTVLRLRLNRRGRELLRARAEVRVHVVLTVRDHRGKATFNLERVWRP